MNLTHESPSQRSGTIVNPIKATLEQLKRWEEGVPLVLRLPASCSPFTRIQRTRQSRLNVGCGNVDMRHFPADPRL